MPRRFFGAILLVTLMAIASPSARAEPTCQDPVGDGTVLVCTTGDPTTGQFGVGVHVADRVDVCFVMMETCP